MEIPIVYINLQRDVQRRLLLEKELARHELPGKRLDAVWWNDLAQNVQDSLYSACLNRRQYYQPLVNGEKGCYASHIAAWQQLVNSTAPAMVVLEDDVRLLEDFGQTLTAITNIKQPWDMVKLLGRTEEKIYRQRSLTPSHALIQYTRVPSFTAAYVISRSGAMKMLQNRVPFGRPVDIDLRFWWENDMQIYGVHPAVVALDESSQTSSITGRQERQNWRARWKKIQMKISLAIGSVRHMRKHDLPE